MPSTASKLPLVGIESPLPGSPGRGFVVTELVNNQTILNMPYESVAQRGWAHTPAGTKALGGPEKVAEWDKASKGKKLPDKKSNKSTSSSRQKQPWHS